jgi:uncharacterized repeat protein (TIGR01451 family)
VLADAVPEVTVRVAVEREVTKTGDDGQQLRYREPVRDATPGDVLVYTLTATNVGDAVALNAALKDPIPAGTVLLVESVQRENQRVRASVDGGRTWQNFPATVRRPLPEGGFEIVPAPAEAYTDLSWVLDGRFEAGATRQVSFKVEIR